MHYSYVFFSLEWNCTVGSPFLVLCKSELKRHKTKPKVQYNVSLNFTIIIPTIPPHTCLLYKHIPLVHLYLISILLIKWKTAQLPSGYYSARTVSVWFIVLGLIQSVSPTQNLIYLTHMLKLCTMITMYMYVNLIYKVTPSQPNNTAQFYSDIVWISPKQRQIQNIYFLK